MRIRRVNIDGYGRLAKRAIEFVPGLQVIVGPNEQGKSTIRAFIGDMLYGQKRSTTQRLYDDSQQLHVPWDNPEVYGGRLMYALDDGRDVEITRNFDRRRESVQVFDLTHARDITGDFERLRSHEIDFASIHLGVSKDVFMSTATIGHFTLEDLGDKDALNQIREKLLSLADTGEEANSADAALRRLQDRIAAIGQPNARTKPLPITRARLTQLDEELSQARAVHESLAGLAERRRTLQGETAALRQRRAALEEELRVLEAHERAGRLNDAETLSTRIDTATQHCFALSAARDFPLVRTEEMQQAANRLSAARAHLERTRADHDQIARQAESERTTLGQELLPEFRELPEPLEASFEQLNSSLQRIQDRMHEVEANTDDLRVKFEEHQETLARLPDFSGIGQDPIEWLSQLANSFSITVRARDEECAARDRLRAEVAQRRVALLPAQELFRDCPDFPERARESELGKRMHTEQIAQKRLAVQALNGDRQECADKVPGLLWMAVLSTVFCIGVLSTYFITANRAILLPGAGLLAAIAYFMAALSYNRAQIKKFTRQIAEGNEELALFEQQDGEGPELIERLMQQSNCETIRELEAMYDQYRAASAELAARLEVLENQETRAAENEERVPRLLDRVRDVFGQAGQKVEKEQDVAPALTGAITRYQEYREVKRRVNDTRAQIDRGQNELKRLADSRAQTEEAIAQVNQEMRAFLRENGFAEERDHETAGAALRAYRAQMSALRERRGRVDLLGERVQALARQFEEEQQGVERCEQDLARILAAGGVSTPEQWHAMEKQARELQEVWSKRRALEEQLNTVLRGESIHDLRTAVAADGPLPPHPKQGRDQLKAESEETAAALDARMKEEHELHIAMTERSAGIRSINEIEEERDFLERRVGSLEFELDAASHAMTLIEDIARDKHARIAPRLATRAGAHLSAITDGAYSELLISRDLTISVRLPQNNRLAENPERSLSKGTVDQIYLALRLALVQEMSQIGESIPMLLDDPFANYDDARLDHTMWLLATLARDNQILLFTCREDVVRATEAVGAPVIRL